MKEDHTESTISKVLEYIITKKDDNLLKDLYIFLINMLLILEDKIIDHIVLLIDLSFRFDQNQSIL